MSPTVPAALVSAARRWRAGFAIGALLLAATAAAAASHPSPPLDEADARFFLTRTGFAPSQAQVAQWSRFTREQAVERVLQQTSEVAVTPVPELVQQAAFIAPRQMKDKSEAEKKAQRQLEARQAQALRGWWLHEMLVTPTPLTERMTLFWHNHFVSSQQKVQRTKLMYEQNLLLRKYATGNFAAMLHAVAKDPAMLVYLDNNGNRKGKPNENFAREVMELFTLGEGHYAEADVGQAARALTGWGIDGDSGAFVARPGAHDDGVKHVLGQDGNFDGDAVLDLLLAQPACAEFIVGKLWREFISPEPDAAEVRRIARKFRDSHYEIKVALRELFLAPAFWQASNRASLVKSPVELLVGTISQFQFQYDDTLAFGFATAQLGQDLFNPPNVKGWPGGDAWIDSTTLLARKNLLERLFRTVELGKPRADMAAPGMAAPRAAVIRFADAASNIALDPAQFLAQYGTGTGTPPTVRQRLAIQQAVLAQEPSAPINSDLAGIAYLRMLVLDPVYQLK